MEENGPGAAEPEPGASQAQMEENGPGAAEPQLDASEARGSSPDAPRSVEGVILASLPILDLSHSGLHHLGEVFKIPTLKVSRAFLKVLGRHKQFTTPFPPGESSGEDSRKR